MRIADAAAAACTTPLALCFFCEDVVSFPPPHRTATGQRVYDERDLARGTGRPAPALPSA